MQDQEEYYIIYSKNDYIYYYKYFPHIKKYCPILHEEKYGINYYFYDLNDTNPEDLKDFLNLSGKFKKGKSEMKNLMREIGKDIWIYFDEIPPKL